MKKTIVLLLVLALVLSLAGCVTKIAGKDETLPPETSQTPEASPETETSPSPEQAAPLRIGFLKGPTGVGAAYLMEQAENGETSLNYEISLEADPSMVTSALIAGELDMAAVPTNVAATLYNKTNGNVKILAINTMGVLYILENGESISSVADLAGKTIYATGQGSNPEYVLNYVLEQNGLTPGTDVTVEYLNSDELATRMAAGELEICMLPVPAATSVLLQNESVRIALSLTEEWEAASGGASQLTQGCVVARTDLVEDGVIAQFLQEYGQSISFMMDEANLEQAAELAVKYEIVGNTAVAQAAIPTCNQVFLTGAAEMKEVLAAYYDVLFQADPTSIGGAVPKDDFYYEAPAA